VSLALTRKLRPVANDLDADGMRLIVVTGANQGGKSTFLRSVGLAHVMASAGLFVGAEAFRADHHSGYFTHYRREEDAGLRHGKFDEELARMSTLADALAPGALVLFNESFASTDAREGSEIGTQIVRALLDAGVTVVFVTHLYPFARGWFDAHRPDVRFLQPERLPDGARTFRLHEAPPEETSYGEDVYAQVFGNT
jgi:DNA mismatch repair ATPase MutS